MATPTPGKHITPQVVATPPVSTPFSHLGFSPHGPRSVQPSPQHIKKSPANSNTLYGYPSANHPTNSSYGAGYDSPSAAMALGGVPGLGELGMDGIGTPGMGVGLGSLGGVRGDDQERSRRLAAVVDILKASKGRLSETGMEHLARKVGLECLWESHMGSGGSSRTLIMAGSALALDIDFNNNEVRKVTLAFPDSPDIVTKHAEKAGAILLADLQIKPTESPLTKMLDQFAVNLERLALMDKLSVIPGLNCYEAIAGLYEGFALLHEYEVAWIGEDSDDEFEGKGKDYLSRASLCRQGPRPLMHARGRIGLSLDYWEDKQRISKKTSTQEPKIWSLLIECAPIPLSIQDRGMSLRVSSNWMSRKVKRDLPEIDGLLYKRGDENDWQTPEYNMLPVTDPPQPDVMGDIGQLPTEKYPDVMFVAKFDPPVVLPLGLASTIMFQCTSNHLEGYYGVFDQLLFPHDPDQDEFEGSGRKVSREVLVPVFGKEGETTRRHSNNLYIDKNYGGKRLTEVPFVHPSQLMDILPTLRLYAFISTVLGKSFGSTAVRAPKLEPKQPTRTKLEELRAIIDGEPLSDTPSQQEALPIDVTLSIPEPEPRVIVEIDITFPFKQRTGTVKFEIEQGPIVRVVGQNILDAMNESKGRKITAEDLATMLEITEDLGIWVEYVRRRLE